MVRTRRNSTRFARSGDLRIAYELRGSRLRRGSPWLVLVQGLGFDRAGWEPVVGRLQRRYRLVLIDNRGSGDSDPPTESFTVADMARDIVAVLDHAGIDRAHVLGLSLGGMIAQELAAGWPDRVDALVLAATTPGWPSGYPMPPESVALLAQRTRDRSHPETTRRHVTNALARRTAVEQPALVDRLVAHVLAHPTAGPSWAAQAAAGARYTNRGLHRRIRARTLVVHGDADTVVDPRNARLLAERIDGAELIMFAGRGHLFLWEDPAGLVAAVSRFLDASPPAQRKICRPEGSPAPR
jgi:3-oxoadipate enol-lactonase